MKRTKAQESNWLVADRAAVLPVKKYLNRGIKAGLDADGRAYIDFNDKGTAESFLSQAERFSGIKLSTK